MHPKDQLEHSTVMEGYTSHSAGLTLISFARPVVDVPAIRNDAHPHYRCITNINNGQTSEVILLKLSPRHRLPFGDMHIHGVIYNRVRVTPPSGHQMVCAR